MAWLSGCVEQKDKLSICHAYTWVHNKFCELLLHKNNTMNRNSQQSRLKYSPFRPVLFPLQTQKLPSNDISYHVISE